MIPRVLFALSGALLLFASPAVLAGNPPGAGDRQGLLCVGDQPFPIPAGSETIAPFGGDFETDGKFPWLAGFKGWWS